MSQSDSYPNWVFSVFSAIGFVLCCVPFPWHLQGKLLPLRWCLLLTGSILAWNAGTCLVMAWLGLTCLGLCINSIIWKGNSIDWAPVWCDICEFHHAPYRDIEVSYYIFQLQDSSTVSTLEFRLLRFVSTVAFTSLLQCERLPFRRPISATRSWST